MKTKTKTINCIIISGNDQTTKMMQAFDVFENFKVVANVRELKVDIKGDKDTSEFLTFIRDSFTEKGERVVAVFIPGEKEGAWVDKTVKVISDGSKWMLLDKVLEFYKFTQ